VTAFQVESREVVEEILVGVGVLGTHVVEVEAGMEASPELVA
jgi:hypothetical protein